MRGQTVAWSNFHTHDYNSGINNRGIEGKMYSGMFYLTAIVLWYFQAAMPSITVCPTALTVFLEGNALYDPCQNQTQLFLKVSVLKRLGTAIFSY